MFDGLAMRDKCEEHPDTLLSRMLPALTTLSDMKVIFLITASCMAMIGYTRLLSN